jgi:site-specific DNA recombinase
MYARYSSDNQSEASIEDQLRLCRERREGEGWDPAGEFVDRAMSGASVLRPGLQALLADARMGGFDLLLCEALDRLSRDQADVAAVYKELKFQGVTIVTLAEGEISELHVGLKGTMNALFLKDLADKTKRGLRGRVEAGRSAGGLSYGYDVVRELDQRGEPIRGGRTVNPAEADTVRTIFEAYAAGKSPKSIARDLNQKNVPSPSGKRWRDTTIRGHITRGTGVLNNELYVGKLIWNRQRYIKDPATGRRVSRINPETTLSKNYVPDLQIVDDELWQRVKARQLGIRESDGVAKARASRFWEQRRPRHLLTGLMVCGACGEPYASIGRDYVACSSARGTGTCGNSKSLRRGKVEDVILNALKCRLMAPDLVEEFIVAFHAETNKAIREAGTLNKVKEQELAKVTRQLDGLYDAIADGLRTAGLKEKLEDLEARKQELAAELAAQPAAPPLLHPNLAELYRRKVEALHQTLRDPVTRDEALGLIRGLIEQVIVHPSADGPELELVGEIASMVALAQAQAPGSGGPDVLGAYRSSVKVVAGRGFEPLTFRL